MKKTFFFLSFLPVLMFLLAWQEFVADVPRRLFLFGSPLLILHVAGEDFPHASLWQDMGVTLSALLAGLSVGTAAGTLGGLLLSVHPVTRKMARPYLIFLASVQIFTIAPLLIFWFGIGWGAKVVLAALATFFVALQQACNGAADAEKHYVSYAQSLHANRWLVLWRIILPGAVHWVLAGIKLNIGFAILGVLIGEFISAESGLGHYIFKASGIYDVPRVWLGVLLLSVMALVLNALAEGLVKLLAVGRGAG